MKYFVTGATGLIGSHVTERLVEDGHDVVALTRSRSNASHLPADVTVVEGDVTEKESMRAAMTGVDGVFHIAAWYYVGPGPRAVETAERINVEGTRNVLELMGELGVPRGVYTSTIGVYPPAAGGTIDESVAPDRPDGSVYVRTKWQAQYEVAQPMIDDGLPLVIVQPGIVYGPGDKRHGSVRQFFRDYLQGNVPLCPREGYYAPLDHVEDTARAHVLAMDRGEPGDVYIIANEPRELTEVLAFAEECTGVPAPRAVSPKLFGGLAGALSVVERAVTPPKGFEAEWVRMFAGTRWPVDNTKATTELGLEHRPLEDGLCEYLDWEAERLAAE
ncbi:NAD-dependent epimerase/dehydratase family protein [Natrononativus amylolyticus]|uniref:NAD-dependent epimerase/dehydratase family protein n=1 Tax=Natrononativus amylolyticus TaxID=2963434 RepID=UPI0020CE5C6B|nr:NAD-dependent epimerase/dehydratase family protein [Natrononativus amylolyticus]